jgi:hypothetical protein
MKNIAFGAMLVGLLAAGCGGSSKSNPDAPGVVVIDASPDGGSGACDPVAQTGCTTGQKCTWVRIAASTSSQVGTLQCAPDGTVALNGACTWGAAGATTGYDNCQHGLICLASSRTDMATGTCSTICDTSAASGAAGACPMNYACGKYSNFFENTGDPANNIGLCDPTCNPLTQNRDYDTAAHCGGPLDTNNKPTRECNGLPSSDASPSHFTCSSVLDPTKVGDTDAYDATLGGVYLNSCAAGYIPLLYDNTTDAAAQNEMKVICVAFCQPSDTSTAATTMAGGTAPYTCAAAGTGGTHECRYWWFLESSTTMMSQWSNGLGYCFDYTNYTYDGSMLHPATSTTTPDPSCKTLSNTTKTIDDPTKGGTQMVADNIFWGCGAEPTAFVGGTAPKHAPSPFKPLLDAKHTADVVGSWK